MIKSIIGLTFFVAITVSAQSNVNIFSIKGTILDPSPHNGGFFLGKTDGWGINFTDGVDGGQVGPFVNAVEPHTVFPTDVEYISRDTGLVMYQWGPQLEYVGSGHDYGGDFTRYTLDVSGSVPAVLTLASGQGQNPAVHAPQPPAAAAEPVDTATGYLWYTNTLLKENGAQELRYGINAKFGGVNGADFGSTYDVSLRIVGKLTPGTPCITVVTVGRGIHNYYENAGECCLPPSS
jgi:hypothetical protein